MNEKQSIIDEFRKIFKDWSEEELNEYAEKMIKKYNTIKRGENVVHLEYYDGLINDNDIANIEESLASVSMELSRFDKNDVFYASLEQFMLQIALFLNDKTTQDVLGGVGTNAIWDAIKSVTFYVWSTVRNRSADKHMNSKKMLNCGIKMSIDKNTKFEFKIDGDLSDETALKAIDKILDFLKTATPNKSIKRADFVTFEQDSECWRIVDVNEEIRKQMIAKIEKEKNET